MDRERIKTEWISVIQTPLPNLGIIDILPSQNNKKPWILEISDMKFVYPPVAHRRSYALN